MFVRRLGVFTEHLRVYLKSCQLLQTADTGKRHSLIGSAAMIMFMRGATRIFLGTILTSVIRAMEAEEVQAWIVGSEL